MWWWAEFIRCRGLVWFIVYDTKETIAKPCGIITLCIYLGGSSLSKGTQSSCQVTSGHSYAQFASVESVVSASATGSRTRLWLTGWQHCWLTCSSEHRLLMLLWNVLSCDCFAFGIHDSVAPIRGYYWCCHHWYVIISSQNGVARANCVLC